jgi:hypothetical protein
MRLFQFSVSMGGSEKTQASPDYAANEEMCRQAQTGGL